jgi:hypothetical protein
MDEINQIENDVMTMAGGHFTPAALGPEGFAAIRDRAREQPDAYLDAFERMFMGVRFNAELHAAIVPTVFLDQLRDVAPERVRALAASLLKQYDAVLVIYDQFPDKAMLDQQLPARTANYLIRLSEHRRELRRLLEEK